MLIRLNFILKLRIFIYKTRNKISIILNYIFRIPFLFIPSPYPPRTKSVPSSENNLSNNPQKTAPYERQTLRRYEERSSQCLPISARNACLPACPNPLHIFSVPSTFTFASFAPLRDTSNSSL